MADLMQKAADMFRFNKAGRSMEQALSDLQRDIQNVVDMTDLSRTAGWQKLSAVLQESVGKYQVQINDLAKNPAKNAGQLQEINALREAIQALLDIFDNALKSQAELLNRKQQLEEKLEEARVLKQAFESR
jgi:hypothetical protein